MTKKLGKINKKVFGKICQNCVIALITAGLMISVEFAFRKEKTLAREATFRDCVEFGARGIRLENVSIPQRDRSTELEARVYAPDPQYQISPCPLIAILPGGGAGIESVEWAAYMLASDGYIAIVVKPERGASISVYDRALRSAIDYMQSESNPFFADTNIEAIGAAGWSYGARTLSFTQEEDNRLDAIVAWDNLAINEQGDFGSPNCLFNSFEPERIPKVPAMGQASDSCKNNLDPEVKKTAYNHWIANNQSAMQVVFAGWNHLEWSADGSYRNHRLSHHYTLAWFDYWLKQKPSAVTRLLATEVDRKPVEEILSSNFNSALSLNNYQCTDLIACLEELETRLRR